MSQNFEVGTANYAEVADGGWFGGPDMVAPAIARRLPQFLAVQESAQAILAGLTIDVIGAGSVGRSLAMHSARLQPRAVRIVDPACYKPESLLTQAITSRDVDRPKAFNAAQACKAISPQTRVHYFEGKFQDLDLLATELADVVLLATDNLAAEVAVSERSRRLGKLVIQASVFGDALVAQVRCIRNKSCHGPCLVCAYGAEEWEHYERQTEFSCSGRVRQGDAVETPTVSTSFLCSMAADLAMVQLVRSVLGLGSDVADTLVEYCGYTHATLVARLSANAACPRDHAIWRRRQVDKPLQGATLRELAQSVNGFSAACSADASYTVGGRQFVESGYCCGRVQGIRCFARVGEAVGCCGRCGKPMHAARVFSRDRVAAASLGPLLDRPLQALGAAEVRWVAVHGPEESVLAHDVIGSAHGQG